MNFYKIEPDVAGGLGENTILDPGVHPPIVSRLHYQFDDWSGDALVASFPCFLVTQHGRNVLQFIGASGIEFSEVEVTTSEIFKQLKPNLELPKFHWLKVVGEAGQDDLGIGSDLLLIMSERALTALQGAGLPGAIISAC